MLTRIREPVEGTYVVTLFDATTKDIETRETNDLAQALAWQRHVQMHGSLPTDEPEVKAAKKKGKAK